MVTDTPLFQKIILYDYLVTVDASDMYYKDVIRSKILGVTIDANLSFVYHINENVNLAYFILVLRKRNFPRVGKESCILLFKSMVQSHLKFSKNQWKLKR